MPPSRNEKPVGAAALDSALGASAMLTLDCGTYTGV